MGNDQSQAMKTVIDYIDNKSSKTIVSFTGIRHGFGAGGFRKEFIGFSKQSDFNVMFVADKEVSWYNTIDINKIKSKLTNQDVVTIGNSMGGYNAIQFTNDFNVTKAIAFSPQYSVHPQVVPHEKRWRKWSRAIKQWRYEHLIFNETTEYYIFSGNDKLEMYHTNMIPNQRNIHTFIAEGGHKLSEKLKDDGVLYSIVYDCINETPKFVETQYAENIERLKYDKQ